MPWSRRSKFEKPIWRTTVLIVLSILAMISASSEFLSSGANQPVLQKSKRGHFAEHRRRFAVGDRRVEHQRALRFAGEDAVHAVAEFVRQRHHVPVGSQIIQQRVRHGFSARQHVRGIECAAAFFLRHRHVDAPVGKKTFSRSP